MPTQGQFAVKRALVRLAVVVALVAGVVLLYGAIHSWALRQNTPSFPAAADLPVLGKADPGWKLETLDGHEVTFGSFQGRTVFLNIWATWCPPCIAEIPSIEFLNDSVKDDGVAMVLVSPEPLDEVAAFVKKRGWHVPIYVAREGMPLVFQTANVPTTYIVNRRGEIVFQHIGRADWNTEECREFLRRLQAE